MRINRREMAFILLGGLVIIALIYYLVIVSPAVEKQEALAGYIEKKRSDLIRMRELRDEWNRFQEGRVRAEKTINSRGKGFTLLSFLEGVTREIGVDKKIQYMKPLSFSEQTGPWEEVGIEIKLDDIDMRALTRFLYEIEGSERLLNISRIKINSSEKKDATLLTVILQVNTWQMGGTS
jgi:hypothetical protein